MIALSIDNRIIWLQKTINKTLILTCNNEWDWCQLVYFLQSIGKIGKDEDLGNLYPFKRKYLSKILKVITSPRSFMDENTIYRGVLSSEQVAVNLR